MNMIGLYSVGCMKNSSHSVHSACYHQHQICDCNYATIAIIDYIKGFQTLKLEKGFPVFRPGFKKPYDAEHHHENETSVAPLRTL